MTSIWCWIHEKAFHVVTHQREWAFWTDSVKLKHSSNQKVLGVAIDNKLSLDERISNICKIANKKLCAHSRINHCMKQNKKQILFPSFIVSFILAIVPSFGCFAPKNYQKDKSCSWKIFTDYSKWLRVSLLLIIREAHQITFHERCINSLMIEVPEWTFTWHYELYFQVKRKYVQSLKLSHLPDKKPTLIEMRTRFYSISC